MWWQWDTLGFQFGSHWLHLMVPGSRLWTHGPFCVDPLCDYLSIMIRARNLRNCARENPFPWLSISIIKISIRIRRHWHDMFCFSTEPILDWWKATPNPSVTRSDNINAASEVGRCEQASYPIERLSGTELVNISFSDLSWAIRCSDWKFVINSALARSCECARRKSSYRVLMGYSLQWLETRYQLCTC